MSVPEPCFLCGGESELLLDDAKDFFVLKGKSDVFGINYCNICKLAFSVPFLDDLELAEFYPDNFEAYVPKKSIKGFIQKLKYRADLKILKKYIPIAEPTLYEIGAGRGEFLAEAQKAGFDVSGLEPGKEGRKYAREIFDIELSGKTANQIEFNKRYDVIVMKHVLEHINQAESVLRKIYSEGLKEDGVLFLKLPRIDSWEFKFFGKYWHGLDLPRHRLHFSKEGIVILLEKIGLEVSTFKAEVTPLDIMRSIGYVGSYGSSVVIKIIAIIFSLMPFPLKLIMCQLIGLLLSPFGPGRMVLVANKKKSE